MARNKVIKEQKSYESLQGLFDEMSDHLQDVIADNNRFSEELRYLNEFIHYKKLDEEFLYFRENAVEEYVEDLPFPYLTLK